jgi:predicted lysophospholipase L1 biosynthesis ABC-type transport system permease subunit
MARPRHAASRWPAIAYWGWLILADLAIVGGVTAGDRHVWAGVAVAVVALAVILAGALRALSRVPTRKDRP